MDMIRIIGIDPGLRRTGWGIIDCRGNTMSFVDSGTITSKATDPLADRLLSLFKGLEEALNHYHPHEAAVENTFVNKDASATLKLGQARGIAMLAPAKAGLIVGEYAPNMVKKTIVGAGHSDKKQIRMMVSVLLPKATFDTDDAADALAIALCHAQHRSSTVNRMLNHG